MGRLPGKILSLEQVSNTSMSFLVVVVKSKRYNLSILEFITFLIFQFILRQQVVSLYRDFMKVTRHLPPGDREETRRWIRDDFKSNMHLTDEVILINLNSTQLY